MSGNLEKIGGKRVLGRGSNGVSGTQLVMNYVKVFILRAVGRVLCQAGVLVTCESPKAKDGQRRTRGGWETSEEGQGNLEELSTQLSLILGILIFYKVSL